MADRLNGATKHVASRTLSTLDWSNSVLLGDDVPAGVARVKGEDGPELQVHGSANLIQTLLAHELIDEFRCWIFPVVLGTGKRLFEEGAPPTGLTLVDSLTSTTGVVLATYRPAGGVEKGSFAFREPSDAEVRRRESL
jgi:dihydrofolate reductase